MSSPNEGGHVSPPAQHLTHNPTPDIRTSLSYLQLRFPILYCPHSLEVALSTCLALLGLCSRNAPLTGGVCKQYHTFSIFQPVFGEPEFVSSALATFRSSGGKICIGIFQNLDKEPATIYRTSSQISSSIRLDKSAYEKQKSAAPVNCGIDSPDICALGPARRSGGLVAPLLLCSLITHYANAKRRGSACDDSRWKAS